MGHEYSVDFCIVQRDSTAAVVARLLNWLRADLPTLKPSLFVENHGWVMLNLELSLSNDLLVGVLARHLNDLDRLLLLFFA